MPSFSTLLQINLAGADTTAGAAGSATGVPPLVDRAGTQYSISSHRIAGRVYSQVGQFASVLYYPTAVGDGRVTIGIPPSTTEPGTQNYLTVLRMSADATKYYVAVFAPGAPGQQGVVQVWRMDNALTGSARQVSVYNHFFASGTFDPAAAYTFQVSATGSSPTTLTCSVIDHTGATVFTDSATDATAGYQTTGYLGVGTDNNNQPAFLSSALLESGGFGGSVLAPGSSTVTANTINWTASTGGTAPIAYKVYGSQTAGFTPGPANLLGTTSGLTYTHTPGTGPGSAWFYQVIAGDATTPTPLAFTTNAIGQALGLSAEVLGIAGDSIANYDHSAPGLVAAFQGDCPGRTATVALDDGTVGALQLTGQTGVQNNQGCPGTTTLDWLPTSTNTAYTAGDGVARNAIANCVHWWNLRGVTIGRIRLGTNDSKLENHTTPSAYQSNMATIAAYLLANVPTLRTLGVAEPPYVIPGATVDFNAASPGLTRQYGATLAAVDNGTTIRAIGRGVWSLTAAGYSVVSDTLDIPGNGALLSTDGIHPSPAGHAAIDAVDGAGLAAAAGDLVTLGSSGPVGTIPAASDTRFGVAVGSGTGTCHVPTGSQTLSGVPVDATVGNVTLPTASQLIVGASCGVAGNSVAGNVVQAAAGDVRAGTPFGPSNGLVGTLVVTSGGSGVTLAQLNAALASGIATLAPSGLDAIQVEVGMNARQALSPIAAFAGGTLAGAGTGSITIKGAGTATTRVQATTDASGNRTSVTLILPN